MTLFCLQPSCGSKITYSGVKPKKCPYCSASTDPLANFKPIIDQNPEAPGAAAKASARPAARPTARRMDRWSAEGNVVNERNDDVDSGETFESIGIDQHAFAARVEGETDRPMTVKDLRESSGGGSFVRATLSPEENALKAEAMKHMMSPALNQRA